MTDANGYKLEYRESGGTNWTHGNYTGSNTSGTVFSLTCDTEYEFRVRARGDGDPYSTTYGSGSTAVSKTTSECLAPAPTGLRVTSFDDDSVTMSWTAVTDAHGYKLEYRESDDTTWIHGNYSGSSTSGTIFRLTCNTEYDFRVRARGDGDPYSRTTYGPGSTSVTKTTSECLAPAPTGLKVTSSRDDRVTLSWNAVTDAPRLQT